ncbi:YIP1 family protein [Carboxylicivirga sp. RSCT41]|uniref:YIP1 family protein n=1 Tax=Carboxylicivirga agarovorans TaxID=3417570 RepID=UPI003D34A36F
MSKEAISLSVLYKNLIGRLKELIINPRKEWEMIFNERKSINEILAQFNFPLIGLYTSAVFVGYLISHQELDFESALKEAVFTFSSYFFGLYLCYYLLVKLLPVVKIDLEKAAVFQLVAYSSGVMYLTGSVAALVPETIVIASIINLYVIYLVWVSVSVLINTAKEQRIWMTFIAGVLILFLPTLIHRLFVYISNLTL